MDGGEPADFPAFDEAEDDPLLEMGDAPYTLEASGPIGDNPCRGIDGTLMSWYHPIFNGTLWWLLATFRLSPIARIVRRHNWRWHASISAVAPGRSRECWCRIDNRTNMANSIVFVGNVTTKKPRLKR